MSYLLEKIAKSGGLALPTADTYNAPYQPVQSPTSRQKAWQTMQNAKSGASNLYKKHPKAALGGAAAGIAAGSFLLGNKLRKKKREKEASAFDYLLAKEAKRNRGMDGWASMDKTVKNAVHPDKSFSSYDGAPASAPRKLGKKTMIGAGAGAAALVGAGGIFLGKKIRDKRRAKQASCSEMLAEKLAAITPVMSPYPDDMAFGRKGRIFGRATNNPLGTNSSKYVVFGGHESEEGQEDCRIPVRSSCKHSIVFGKKKNRGVKMTKSEKLANEAVSYILDKFE